MRVVDEDERRTFIGIRGEQAERGGADRKPVAGGARANRQRRFECGGLWRWDALQQHERRAQQLEQPREGNVCLRLDPAGAQDA